MGGSRPAVAVGEYSAGGVHTRSAGLFPDRPAQLPALKLRFEERERAPRHSANGDIHVRRQGGRPQIRAACAPKTYHGALSRAKASARSARRSARPGGDGTKGLCYALVGREIRRSFGVGRPVGTNCERVPAQLISNGQQLGRRQGPFPLQPVARFRLGNHRPVAAGEREDVVAIHAAITALRGPWSRRDRRPTRPTRLRSGPRASSALSAVNSDSSSASALASDASSSASADQARAPA